MKKYVLAVIVPLATFGIVSCSVSQHRAAPPQIGPIPHIESPAQITRPIFTFTVTGDQATAIQKAARIGSESCMRGFGFSIDLPEPQDLNAFVQEELYSSPDYGFFNPAADLSKGYDLTGGTAPLDVGLLDRIPADERAVLEGAEPDGHQLTTFRGLPVPNRGCAQSGRDAVGGELPVPQYPRVLPDHGPVVPQTDPRIVAVNKQWSDCMHDKGFHYANPVAAIADPRWRQSMTSNSGTHSPDEIATATADLACKQSVNLVGVVVAVETAYDHQYIASHADLLQHFEEDLDRKVQRASAIIAAHPDLP